MRRKDIAKKVLGLLLRLFFTATFLGLVVERILQVIANDVGSRSFIDRNASFPSLTICPFLYHSSIQSVSAENNYTFDDLMKIRN